MIDNSDNLALPTVQQAAWGDAEIGVIIHLDLQVFEPSYDFRRDRGYHPDPAVFAPTNLNTDRWIEAAVSAGAKYAVLVAKHCSGFSLWPTRAHSFSVAASPWKGGKGDIVADFMRSCEKYGIRPGLYCSLSCNAYLNVDDPGKVLDNDPASQERYNEIALAQLSELWSDYGKLFQIWFDGGVVPAEQASRVADLMAKLQPEAVAFQGPRSWPHLVRDCGNELAAPVLPNWSVTDAETYQENNWFRDRGKKAGDPNGDLWAQTECPIPNRKAANSFQGGWFWREGEEQFLYSADELVEAYLRTVGQNANMLIGMVIDNRGCFPEADAQVFEEFGAKVRQLFAMPVANSHGSGDTLTLSLPEGTLPSVIVLMEELAHGERVRRFFVDALQDGNWVPIWTGTCIGHMRIERFEPIRATHLRLRVTESVGKPQIRTFGAWAAEPGLFTVAASVTQRSKIFIGRSREGLVSITCSNPSLFVAYTLDGTEPNAHSPVYSGPFSLPEGGIVKARSFIAAGSQHSDTVTAVLGVARDRWQVRSVSFDSPYANGGAAGVDKLLDDDPETYWQTYDGDRSKSAPPHEVVLDMGESIPVTAVTFLPRTHSLDGTPDRIEFYLSEDGTAWDLVASAEFTDLKENPGARCIALEAPRKGRFLRFVATHVIDDGYFVALAGIGVVR